MYIWVNKSCQVFVNDFGIIEVYPLKNKGGAHIALSRYFKDVGVPTFLHIYNAKEMDVSKKFRSWN